MHDSQGKYLEECSTFQDFFYKFISFEGYSRIYYPQCNGGELL